MSPSGMMPPTRTPTCSSPASRSICKTRGTSVMCAPLKNAQAEPVGVLVGERADDGFGSLPQPGVDDFHPGVT